VSGYIKVEVAVLVVVPKGRAAAPDQLASGQSG
jgi:hypothetical protein